MRPKDADRMADSVDPDKIIPDRDLHFLPIPVCPNIIEQRHDKINNVAVRPAKTQISLGISPV